jgi:hypothetical protein
MRRGRLAGRSSEVLPEWRREHRKKNKTIPAVGVNSVNRVSCRIENEHR